MLKFFTVTIGQGRESFWRSPEISELVNKLYINVQKVGHNWNTSYTKWVIWKYFTKPTLHGEEKYDVTTLDKLSSSEILFHYGIFMAPNNTHIYGLITNDKSSSSVSRIVPNTDICLKKYIEFRPFKATFNNNLDLEFITMLLVNMVWEKNNQILTGINKIRVHCEAFLRGHALLYVWILVKHLEGYLSPWTRPLQLVIIYTRYQTNIYWKVILIQY